MFFVNNVHEMKYILVVPFLMNIVVITCEPLTVCIFREVSFGLNMFSPYYRFVVANTFLATMTGHHPILIHPHSSLTKGYLVVDSQHFHFEHPPPLGLWHLLQLVPARCSSAQSLPTLP